MQPDGISLKHIKYLVIKITQYTQQKEKIEHKKKKFIVLCTKSKWKK